jgi:hypothetical protein
MKPIESLLRSHPRTDKAHIKDYSEALVALTSCAAACTLCADACLAESGHVEALRHCITTDLDCADVCATTARLLARQTEAPNDLIHAQLHACVLACQICFDECSMHSTAHAHCKLCAEACRHCQERCNFLLGEISSSGTAEETDSEESPAFSA